MTESQPYTDHQGEVQQHHIKEQGDKRIDQSPISFDKTHSSIHIQWLLLLWFRQASAFCTSRVLLLLIRLTVVFAIIKNKSNMLLYYICAYFTISGKPKQQFQFQQQKQPKTHKIIGPKGFKQKFCGGPGAKEIMNDE